MTITAADVAQDLPDRLAKTLRLTGLSVADIAAHLEVHRNTISGWLNAKRIPTAATLMIWAQYTGVPYQWLRDGTWPQT